MSELGPCVICGDTGYNLSCGGPTICPKCDCGHFDAATVVKQAKVIAALRQELERSRGLLTLVLHTEGRSVSAQCSPRSFDETGLSRHLREIIGQETKPPLWIYVTKDQIPVLEAIATRLDWLEGLYAPFITEHPPQPTAAVEILRAALRFIADGYENQDVNHVDFRVKAFHVATEALATCGGGK